MASAKKPIFLDSSMLMLPLEKKINLTAEFDRLLSFSYEVYIPEIILTELKKLKKVGTPSIKNKANFALRLAEQFPSFPSKLEGEADDELLRLAMEHNAIIATNDTELRNRLRSNGLPVISLHGDNRLSLFGDPFI